MLVCMCMASRGNGLENEGLLCWYAIIEVDGCMDAIHESLVEARTDIIGTACCEALNNLEDKCWSLMFPSEPIYPEFLRSCSSETLAPASAPILRE